MHSDSTFSPDNQDDKANGGFGRKSFLESLPEFPSESKVWPESHEFEVSLFGIPTTRPLKSFSRGLFSFQGNLYQSFKADRF